VDFTRPLKLAAVFNRLNHSEVAIMLPTSSGERLASNGEPPSPLGKLEKPFKGLRKGKSLDAEDIILVLLLLASVVVCLLTVIGTFWG
jgi:hypothetical protein